ncbi:hypothetical protein KHM83_16425 [Fusibacter paucivorans]|uniref:Uncharacterized protein n=1 Tax=Fusibacter paucivorans TaxID=76009 RepID=A0ABS5PV11_9FIRM|nr:hypothetical protein [Fusibacter paucivorans]MBS7528276.1 hypothetical protein [Fusibacter paucivorans]
MESRGMPVLVHVANYSEEKKNTLIALLSKVRDELPNTTLLIDNALIIDDQMEALKIIQVDNLHNHVTEPDIMIDPESEIFSISEYVKYIDN